MKKLLMLFLGLLLCVSLHAQMGATCATATPFSSTNSCITNDTLAGNSRWFSFVADVSTLTITTTITGGTGHIDQVDLFSGTCTGLTLVNTMSVDPAHDTIIVLPEWGLTVGSTYYIRVLKTTQGTPVFKGCLDVTDDNAPGCGYSTYTAIAACNMICSGDFEAPNSCPDNFGDLVYANCWNLDTIEYDPYVSPGLYTCLGPNQGTPDLFNAGACPPGGYRVDVPSNAVGNEISHSPGNGYAGIVTFDKHNITLPGIINPADPGYNYREYIGQWLQTPMIVGKKYDLSIWLSLSDSSATGTYVGALFSVGSIDQMDALYINRTPQVETPTIIVNKVGWTHFDTTFVADSAYNFMVIGNFRPDVITNMNVVAPGMYITTINPSFPPAYDKLGYYYLDDITLKPVDSIYTTVSDADSTLCLGDSVTLVTGLSIVQPLEYQWTSNPIDPSLAVNGQDTLSTITVAPTDTTIYYSELTDIYGCKYRDTTQINVVPVPDTPLVVGDSFACVTGVPIPYTITNYDSTLIYSIALLPIPVGGTVTGVDSTGTFYVTWTDNNGGAIIIQVADSAKCGNYAEFVVRPCCVYGDTTFVNDSSANVIAHYGTQFLSVKNFAINGTLWVNQSMTWSACNVKMGVDAKIVVLAPDTLYITQNSTISACNLMWDKIQVQPGAFVWVDQVSIVEDAKTALYSVGGGNFLISNAWFNRNYKHVVVTPFSGAHPGKIEESKFTCEPVLGTLATLNPPFAGYRTDIGVQITGVLSINIGQPGGIPNLFKNMNTGISSLRSSVTVRNNQFRAITMGALPNIGVAAIKAVGQAFTFPVPVYVPRSLTVGDGTPAGSNLINNCVNGIITDLNMTVTVNYNDIKRTTVRAIYIKNSSFVNKVLITKNNIFNFQTGIFMQTNNFCFTNITLNKIRSPLTASTLGATAIAITGISSNLDRDTINNNDIDSVNVGINSQSIKNLYVSGNRINIKPTTGILANGKGVLLVNNTGGQLLSNKIKCIPASTSNLRVIGVYVQDSPNSTLKCNEMHDFGASMEFTGPGNTFGTLFNNLMKNATRGIWLANGTALGNQGGPFPTGVSSDNRWTGTFTAHTFVIGGVSPTNGNLSRIFHRAGVAYTPTVNSFGGGGTFMIPLTVIPTNVISSCFYPIPGSAGHKAMIKVVQDSVYTTTEAKRLSKHAVYRELKADTTLLAGDSILTAFRDSLALENVGKIYDAMEVAGDYNTANYNLARASLASIIPADPIEDYLKTVTDMVLEHQISGTEFDSTELYALRAIAGLCPYTDGTGVYLARALVLPYDPYPTYYENMCETAEERSMIANNENVAVEEADHKLVLYPNPNDGNMTLNYELQEGEKGSLIIYDLTGRELKNYRLSGSNTPLVIKENELSNGLYLFKVIINGKTAKTDRLVIIK